MSLKRSSLVVLAFIAAGPAAAQPPAYLVRPYDGIQAGLDAFRLAEEQRQVAVADQLAFNDQARLWNGYPLGRGTTIYYGVVGPGAAYAYGVLPAATLESVYAYGGRWPPGWHPPVVFEPWPYVPGDIYGYRVNYAPARQPVGQHHLQTGPNRWESHPVYDPPLTRYDPLPSVDSPLLDNTPYAAPAPAKPLDASIPPPPPSQPRTPPPLPSPPSSGPREY
jgi:hypothetical protein